MVRLNSSDEYEFLCKVTLTKDKYPTAFENKVRELIEECGMSREQAEESIENMEIELELYSGDEVTLLNMAKDILKNPPQIGYLTISNALQWRLQYGRIVSLDEKVDGITPIVKYVGK